MKKIIAACGNDCASCPRYQAATAEQLGKTARLWQRIGYRDKIVANSEIKCRGCTPANWCRFKIAGCVFSHHIENCGQCAQYPCPQIQAAFAQTMAFEPKCAEVCTKEEYDSIKKAFFKKKDNLDAVAAGPKAQKKSD